MSNPFSVAIVGCGNISKAYCETLAAYPQIVLRGAFDLDAARARETCGKFGGQAYASLDALLADPSVEAVINLTIHHAHVGVIEKSLEAGKHVHTEKPLAMTYEEASRLADLAERRGLRLSSSPIVFLGEAHQTAFRHIRDGALGEVKVVYAEVNWGRIERWHPNPAPFYEVGVVYDVGVYPLAVLTALFGPARRVQAYARTLLKERVNLAGEPFAPAYPDFVCAMIDFAGGAVCRLTADFYVGQETTRQKGLEFHGDKGSLLMDSWLSFDAGLESAAFGEPLQKLAPVKEPFPGVDWGRCVVELAEAIREGRPHRTGARHAAHVIDIIQKIDLSFRTSTPQAVASTFETPSALPWAQT